MNVVRIIIVLFLFVGFGKVYSQTWDSLSLNAIEYLDRNDTIRALQYAEKALIAAENEYGKNHENYGYSLNNLAKVYDKIGKYNEALSFYLETLQNIEKSIGKDDENYGIALNNVCQLYMELGQYDKALPFCLQSLENIELNLGKSHETYGLILSDVGFLYTELRQLDKAIPYYLQALENTELSLGKSHEDYGTALTIISQLYSHQGEYKKALPFGIEAMENAKLYLEKSNPDYGDRFKNLGSLYENMGQYEKALILFTESMENAKKYLPEAHPDYGDRLSSLGSIYTHLGQYEKALPYYIEASENVVEIFGKTHRYYSSSLNNISILYSKMGQYEKALPIGLEALEISKKSIGKSHPNYDLSLSNLGLLYEEMGQYEKALPYYLEALENAYNSLGTSHPEYAIRLSNLGGLYKSIGNHNRALELYLEALKISEVSLGKEHPDYGIRLNNLGSIYSSMGKYDKALNYYLEALTNAKMNLGESHPDYGIYLNNVGSIYSNVGQYEKALSYYLEALENTKINLRESHPDYGNRLNNLGLIYQKMGQYDKALLLIHEAIKNTYYQINQSFTFLSENEMEMFYKTISHNFNVWQSFFNLYSNEKPEMATCTYDIELANKGMILQSGIHMRNAILVSDDPKSLGIFDTWTSYKNMLGKEYSKPILEQRSDIKEVEEKTNSMESELTKISSTFASYKKIGNSKWQEIQTNLGANEVAIEFSSFRYRNNKEWTDSTLYVANILRKEDAHPHIVYLFEQKQIDSLLERKVVKESSFINTIYSERKMYELIWKPIESYLQKGDQIYFAPSGILNQLNLGAIRISDSTYLSDEYTFHQVGSTAVLGSSKKVEKAVEDIAIFGGIKFDAKEHEITQVITKVPKEQEYVSRGLYMTDATRSGKWIYLEGTLQEAKNIDDLAKEIHISSNLYSGTEAVEEHFKNLSGKKSPSVIHIATHGFFFPDPKSDKQKMNTISFQQENTFTIADNPLNRSGLLFAGGNIAWIGDTITTDREDGILTAYEVSNLSLFNTELVVLSACETGLGDIKGSEGVYGLQRAFKMAGVRYLIMSLWKVPDNATKEFMTTFYTEYLTNQKPVREAFNVTQTKMKGKYRNEPYKWGGFVLME